MVIDLRARFNTPEALEELLTLAAQSKFLQEVAITTYWHVWSRVDLVTTPFTVHVLGYFRSIRELSLTLEDVDGTLDEVKSLSGSSSLFPELYYLRLKALSFATATWFFDACVCTKIEDIYIHFMTDLPLKDLTRFFSSLEQFRPKLSQVATLGVRAMRLSDYTYEDLLVKESNPHLNPDFQPLVVSISRIFPHVIRLRLKLSSRDLGLSGFSFLQRYDLFTVGNAFPDLEVLMVKIGSHAYNDSRHTCRLSLQDVVDFAHQFPMLRRLGFELEETRGASFFEHLADKSTPVLSAESDLSVLKVKDSLFPSVKEEELAAYLRMHLPNLRSVKRSQFSPCHSWDKVDQLLSAK